MAARASTRKAAPVPATMPAPSSPFAELGRTGLRAWGGSVYEEALQRLIGARGIAIYQEMASNDPVIAAMLYAVRHLMLQASWTVEPADASPEAAEQAEFLRGCLDDLSSSWQATLSEILDMVIYGWSAHELVYKRRLGMTEDPTTRSRFADGRLGWRKWPIRAQDSLVRWQFDDAGGVRAMEQAAPPDYRLTSIPIERLLLFRTTEHKGNPEGRSLLRGAYRAWWFKKRIEENEAIGIERDLAGYPVYRVHREGPDLWAESAAATALLQELQRQISNIRVDEQQGAVLPWWLDLTLLSTGARRMFDTTTIITRYDQRIAMVMLADFILLGHERVGSFALSSNKTHLFALGLAALLDTIASVINRHAIPRLWALNGWPLARLPKLVPGDVESPDLTELGAYVAALAGAGMPLFPDAALEAQLRAAAGWPAPPEETGQVAKQVGRRLRGGARPRGLRTGDPPWDEVRDAVQEVRRVLATMTRDGERSA
jgi:hypothetical protein